MTEWEYLAQLGDALPFSVERPNTPMSNGELRRHIAQGGVLINHHRVEPTATINYPIRSVVFFPKGSRRTTLV